MGLLTTGKFEPLTKAIQWQQKDWQLIGEFIRNRIRTRTAQGVDGQNQPFAPYSQRYAKERLAAGLEVSPVNLLVSGDMLNAITVKATKNGVTVSFRY